MRVASRAVFISPTHTFEVVVLFLLVMVASSTTATRCSVVSVFA